MSLDSDVLLRELGGLWMRIEPAVEVGPGRWKSRAFILEHADDAADQFIGNNDGAEDVDDELEALLGAETWAEQWIKDRLGQDLVEVHSYTLPAGGRKVLASGKAARQTIADNAGTIEPDTSEWVLQSRLDANRHYFPPVR